MNAPFRTPSAGLVVLAAALLSSTAAYADIDGQDVFDRLKAQMALQGITIDASQVQTEGANVQLTGVEMQFGKDDGKVPAGNPVLHDVSVLEDGSYLVGQIEIDPIKQTDKDVTVDFAGVTIDNFIIAGPDVTDPVLRSGLFTSLDAGTLSVSNADGNIFSMEGFDATMSPYRPGEVMTFTANANNLVGNLNQLHDEKARTTMSALGYDELRGDFVSSGSWDPTNGELIFDSASNFRDAANLKIDFDILGYTPELLNNIQHLQTQMTNASNDAVLAGNLGALEQLKINGLTIQIDDTSLTNRVLDLIAKRQGSDRASIASIAKAIVPIALAPLGKPEFAARASAAVSTFLDDPKNLQISARPANPVPGTELAAAAESNPRSLIDLLGITVAANQ